MNVLREILARFGIEVDTKQLESGNKQVDTFADKLRGFRDIIAGAFVVSSMTSFIKSTFEEGNQLYTLSKRAGMAVESYQALEYTGELLNVSSQQLSVGLKYLHRNLAIAANGSTKLGTLFDKLGVSVKNGVPVDTEQAFRTLADSISAIEDKNIRTAVAMRIFGRAGASLLPMLNAGSQAIDQYTKEVSGLGGGFRTSTTEAIDALDDQSWRQKMAFRSVRAAILDTLLPSLLEGSKGITQMAVGFVELNKHGEAVRTTIFGFGVMAAAILTGMGAKLRAVALSGAKLFIIATALEDIYVWLRGGDSLIGSFFSKFDSGINQAASDFGDSLGLMFGSWQTFKDGVTTGWMGLGYLMARQTVSWTERWGEMVADLKDQWASVKYFFTGMGDPNRSFKKEFEASRDERIMKKEQGWADVFEQDESVKRFTAKLDELKQQRKALAEQQKNEQIAAQWGGAPEDYTPEGMSRPKLTEGQQGYKATQERKAEVEVLAKRYGGKPQDYWTGQGQANEAMIDRLRDLAYNSPDEKTRKSAAALFDNRQMPTQPISQQTALKILEPAGLGDLAKYAQTAVQGPQPTQAMTTTQNLSRVKNYTDNSRNTVNLNVSKGDKRSYEDIGRLVQGGMTLRSKMAEEDEDVSFESDE